MFVMAAFQRAARRRVLGAALGAALLPAGCTSDSPKVQPCPFGDLSLPVEMQIVHLDEQDQVVETTPMTKVPLVAPPQGGWIVLLGVRARNIDGCQTTLTTALVDKCNNQILGLDRRLTKLEPDAGGWGVSSVISLGNLPVCPLLSALRDTDNVPYDITVAVEDVNGQKAQATLTVVPYCQANDPLCTCQCDRDYVLGSTCDTTGSNPGEAHTTCPL
jgi:hypothetical protein